ncbi:MAG: hypothetical protein V1922_03700 [bacterium]
MVDFYSLNLLRSQSVGSLVSVHRQATLEYFVYGNNPRLFISSGMHGDEYKIISSVCKSIKLNLKNLPSFIFVPIVTPSAVEKKTRNNKMGQDVNRGFIVNGTTDESKAMISIIGSNKFDLVVSFHEDWEFGEFYMYDELADDENRDISSLYTKFKQKLIKNGVGLFNGIDDPNDPILGYKFTDGYATTRHKKREKENGPFESWAISQGISSRCFTPEIPAKLKQEVKDKIVEAFFTDLIIPFF